MRVSKTDHLAYNSVERFSKSVRRSSPICALVTLAEKSAWGAVARTLSLEHDLDAGSLLKGSSVPLCLVGNCQGCFALVYFGIL